MKISKNYKLLKYYPKNYGQYFHFSYDGIQYKIHHYAVPMLYAYIGKEDLSLGIVPESLYTKCTFDSISYVNDVSILLYNFAKKKFDEVDTNNELKNKILSKASGKNPIYGADLFENDAIKHQIGHTSYSACDVLLNGRLYAEIDWDVKLKCGVNLQRGFVWTNQQKEQFILQLLHDGYIPPFAAVLYEHQVFRIIDGKQRLNSIKEFVEEKFAITYKNYDNEICFIHFSELNNNAKRKIIHRAFDFNVIYAYKDDNTTDLELVEWFKRINFAGTKVEQDHLYNLYSHLNDDESLPINLKNYGSNT